MSISYNDKINGRLVPLGGLPLEALNSKVNASVISSPAVSESTATAAKAHSKGDYFELNGKFVKALANIAIGDTLVEGTNYESTDVGSELSAANAISSALTVVDPDEGSGGIRFGVDANGNYGYKKVGADTVTPFKNSIQDNLNFISLNTYTYYASGVTNVYRMSIITPDFSVYVFNSGNSSGNGIQINNSKTGDSVISKFSQTVNNINNYLNSYINNKNDLLEILLVNAYSGYFVMTVRVKMNTSDLNVKRAWYGPSFSSALSKFTQPENTYLNWSFNKTSNTNNYYEGANSETVYVCGAMLYY